MSTALKLLVGVVAARVNAHSSVMRRILGLDTDLSDFGDDDVDKQLEAQVAPDGSISGSSVLRKPWDAKESHQELLWQRRQRVARAAKESTVRRQQQAKVEQVKVDLNADINKPVVLIYDTANISKFSTSNQRVGKGVEASTVDAGEEAVRNLLTQIGAAGWPFQVVGSTNSACKDSAACKKLMLHAINVTRFSTPTHDLGTASEALAKGLDEFKDWTEGLLENAFGRTGGTKDLKKDLGPEDPIDSGQGWSDMVDYIKRMFGNDADEGSSILERIKKDVFGLSEWRGWGTKVVMLGKELRKFDPKQLVIVPDSRDVIVNTAPGGMKKLAENFFKMTVNHPHAVVASADASCCNAAMNVAGQPGTFILQNHTRHKRACSSGFGNCVHTGDGGDAPWKSFFHKLANDRGYEHARFPYLNGHLLVGRAEDILRLYRYMQINSEEDDIAIMSEAIYRRPEMIMLDYEQKLFGTNNWNNEHPWHHHHAATAGGCLYDWEIPEGSHVGHFKSLVTGHAPLFIHNSGNFYHCYKKIRT